MAGIDRRAVAGRHVVCRDDVLDRDRHPVKGAARRLGITAGSLGECLIWVDILPRPDGTFPRLDALETAAHEVFRGDTAGGDIRAGRERVRFVRGAHCVSSHGHRVR